MQAVFTFDWNYKENEAVFTIGDFNGDDDPGDRRIPGILAL